jgi:hypothetical protein
MSADRRDPAEAFTAEERELYEFTRDADELACMLDCTEDHYPIEDADFFEPTGGWEGWEDQPEWM